jgi:hypothetical protein
MGTRTRTDFQTPSVADETALSDIWVAKEEDGSYVYVQSTQSYYSLNKSSGAAAVAGSVVAPRAGAPIAGFSAARWVRVTGGSGGAPGLAFLNIAEMAAYDASALTKGTLATVRSLQCPWFYDPTSTLVPDVSAGSPQGRTIVAAAGTLGGNWLRDRQFASLRWKEQPNWFLDPASAVGPANDENDGATALTPLFSHEELMDRISGFAEATTSADITINSDVTGLADFVVIDSMMRSGNQFLFYHGALTVIPFGASPTGVLTAVVNWNPATQTVGTIQSADIPVSWTASGMIDKLVIEIETGVCSWIYQDNGGNIARVAKPRAGVFDLTPANFTPGNHVQVYELLHLGGNVSCQSGGGPGAQVDFQFLHLAEGLSHGFECKLGTSIIDSCHVHGLDSAGAALVQTTNCAMSLGCRAEQGSSVLITGGVITGAEARSGLLDLYQVTVFSDTLQAQQGGVLRAVAADGFVCWIDNVGVCCRVQPGGQLDAYTQGPAYLFGVGVTGTAFQILPQGNGQFDHNKPPVFAGAAIQVQLGNRVTTFAELPYTNPVDQASMVEGNSPDATEEKFTVLAANMTTTSAAYVTLLSQAIVVNGLREVQIDACFSVSTVSASAYMAIAIDGARVMHGRCFVGGGGICGSLRYQAFLASGAHTVEIQWHSDGVNDIFCRPVSDPELESATISTNELQG